MVDITTYRLHNQRISAGKFTKPGQVVAWLGAVQAQDYYGALWALGLRMQSAEEKAVERAFQKGAILRTHFLRPTWHFVSPKDIRWMLALTAPHVHAGNAYMYRLQELDDATYKRCKTIITRALRGGNPLSRDELSLLLQRAGIVIDNGLRLAYIMMRLELDAIICSGPRKGRQFTYMLLEERVPAYKSLDRVESLAELASRYFHSRGPATLQDFAKWSGLSMADSRIGLDSVKHRLEQAQLEDRTYWFSEPEALVKDKIPTVHLLSVYDEYISGYKDRSAMDAGDSAQLFALGNALQFIMILDGLLVGTWRRTIDKGKVQIEIMPFRRLTKIQKQAVDRAAHQYGGFLGLPVSFV